jgi:hypothetical protein
MRDVSGAELMRHALGVHCYPKRGRRRWTKPYRNHFDAGDDDIPAWDALVGAGLAAHSTMRGEPHVYCVTKAGREHALAGITYSTHHAARWGYGEPVNP